MKREVNYKIHLHPDDSTPTFLMVKKFQQEDFNIILVHKPQWEKTMIGPKMYNDNDLKNNCSRLDFKQRSGGKCLKRKHIRQYVLMQRTKQTNTNFH